MHHSPIVSINKRRSKPAHLLYLYSLPPSYPVSPYLPSYWILLERQREEERGVVTMAMLQCIVSSSSSSRQRRSYLLQG